MTEHEPDATDRDGPASRALPLETPAPVELESCPSCGAPLRDPEALLCIRCGYDLRTLARTETSTGEELIGPTAGEPPLVRAGRGGAVLPVAMLVIAAATLLWGLLSGHAGLFATDAEPPVEVPWPDRWTGAARFPILLVLWSVCGLAALATAAWIVARPLGDLRLAVYRVVAIVACASTLRFIALPSPFLEFTAEAAGQALVGALLALLFFRLTPREALAALVLTGAGFFVLTLVAHFVAWAT